jgi:hypothetical protein
MQQYYRKHVVYHLPPLTNTVLTRRLMVKLCLIYDTSQGRNHKKLSCDLCDGGQNLPPLVGIG